MRASPRPGRWLGLLALLAPAAHAQLGAAVGGSIGESLPQYRAFQHADHPTLIETSHDVVRVPASRVLGLMELTLGGPHAGASRPLSGRGIGLGSILGTENAPSVPGGPPTPGVTVTFNVRSTPSCVEPSACVPYTPPIRSVLLVPAVTADTLPGTPVLANSRAAGPGLTLAPEPGTSTLKTFTPAELAALPAVSGARALLPYGFASKTGGPTPGVVRIAFRLSVAPSPTEDLNVVFAVIDTTPR